MIVRSKHYFFGGKEGLLLIEGEGHINNLYNTTFWALVQKGGLDTAQAEERLKVIIQIVLLTRLMLMSRLFTGDCGRREERDTVLTVWYQLQQRGRDF